MRLADCERFGQLDRLERLAVPRRQPRFAIEHENAVLHVVESDPKLRRALPNDPLQSRRLVLLFGEQTVEFDGVVAEDLDGAAHRGDLVPARRCRHDIAAAAGDGDHRGAEPAQPADDVAPNIEPYDQDRAENAHDHGRHEHVLPNILDMGRADGSRRHFASGFGDQLANGAAQRR